MDPLFSSAYFANLGSIGLDAVYHHLYEWGTVSAFVVIGKVYSKELWHGTTRTRQRYINFKITFDERMADGFVFAKAGSAFYKLLSRPELLDLSEEELKKELL